MDPAPEQAIPWLERAAEQGSARAMSLLGSCCRDGDGVEADAEKAVQWYQKAADLEYPPPCAVWGCAMSGAKAYRRTRPGP